MSKNISAKKELARHRQSCGISFKCTACAKEFSAEKNLKRHVKEKHVKLQNVKRQSKDKQVMCDVCEKEFANASTLKRHKVSFHQ